jgi:RNA recognition motif-containing protein
MDIPKIFVAKLNPRISKKDLEREFGNFGDIKDLNLKRGYAFIEYYNKSDAKNAIRELNNQKLFGEQQRIVVELANGSKRERDKRRDRDRRYRRSRSLSRSRYRDKDRDYYYRRRTGPKKTDRCYNCGKEGHWANECTNPRKER